MKGVGVIALIRCVNCGKNISNKAKKCPHCGFVNKSDKNIWFIVICILLFCILVCGIFFAYYMISNNKEENNIKTEKSSESLNTFSFETIDSENVLDEVINDSNVSILFVQLTCDYCKMFIPILENVSNDYDLKVYMIILDNVDISKFEGNEIFDNFINSQYGTPTLFLFDNGNLLDVISGYTEKENLINEFMENNFI